MKFLCPSCKAKYQIADEKVAGRSVRMKCRKCGYVIHVSKAVTDGTASEAADRPSSEWPPSGPGASPSEASSSAPPPVRQSSVPPPPPVRRSSVPPPPARTAPGPKVVSRPTGSNKAPPEPTPPPARTATRGMPQAAPKPAGPAAKAGGQGAAQAAALAARTAPVRAAPPPRAAAVPRVTPGARGAPPPRKGTLQGVGGPQPAATAMFGKAATATAQSFEDEDKTRIVDGASALAGALSGALAAEAPPSSALAGAFSEAVGEPSSTLSGELGAPADEWYVGINGVPVGPIRLSELRSKAGAGAVSYDSLVWRDGFEEWQPLRTFPELVAIVEESLSSARASLTPQIPPTATGTSAPISVQMPGSIPITVASPGFNGGAIAPVTGPAVVTEAPDLDEIPGVRRRATSAAAWIAVVVALLFGLTAGFVLFSGKKPPEPIVKYVEVPAKDQPSGTAPAAPAPSAEELPESTVPGGKQTGGRGPAVAGTAKPPEKKEGLSGLQGLEGLKGLGPAGGPGPGETTRTAGQPLDGTTVQRTVGRYTSSVRRSCWQPALDTRAKDAPTSARVNVTITVGAGGNVQNVSTSGEPRGYRGLANCIASRVRGWTFPASSGTTTVNVPFVFAAQ